METIDLAKKFKTLYTAKRVPQEVVAEAGTFLAVDDRGPPGGEAFQAAIQCLFPAVYTIKFSGKQEGSLDFKIAKLECLYFSDPGTPMTDWQWRVLIRVPDEVTAKHLAATRRALKERKGLDISAVRRVRWKEGRAVQILHVGPYEQVGKAYEQLHAFAKRQAFELSGPAHEIYLNDPRRCAPEKLKTIVRLSTPSR
jgi:hypothetical protein